MADRAFLASLPNTLPKKREATVTPECLISSCVAALRYAHISAYVHAVAQDIIQADNSREVRHIRAEIEDSAYTQPQRAGDFKRADGIFHLVEDIIDIRPPGVRIENLECRGSVLCLR